MNYTIIYNRIFDPKSLKSLSVEKRLHIKQLIEEKLSTRPELYGKPLRQSLKGCRSLRVGDYRVIFRIAKKNVEIYAIGHRSVIYEYVQKKLSN